MNEVRYLKALMMVVRLMDKNVMLDLIKDLRSKYFPHKMNVGECADVCILIGGILKYNAGINVSMVFGIMNNCYHTWLKIDDLEIDVSTDCTTTRDGRDFVTFTNNYEYKTVRTEQFDIKDYYHSLTLEELKEIILNNVRLRNKVEDLEYIKKYE